jgi:hypothetical protein
MSRTANKLGYIYFEKIFYLFIYSELCALYQLNK